jgi:hypothetical protein
MIAARIVAAALLMGAASCATEPGPRRTEGIAMQDTACEVTVRFGSFATGIDRRAEAIVDQLIRADGSITQVTRSPHGMEGEYTLCVRTASTAAADRLFARLKASLGESLRAPVTVTGPQGRSYSAPLSR